MRYMYVKYNSTKRESIINQNNTLEHESCKLSPTKKSHDSIKINNSEKIIDMNSYIDNKNNILNDKITKFFFDSIHKNHLKNR